MFISLQMVQLRYMAPLTWLTRLGVEPRGAPNGATDTSQWLQLPTLGTA